MRRISYRGSVSEWSFNPLWVTLDQRVHEAYGIERLALVSRGRAFVQVDSYRTPEQKEMFERWVLTAEFHDYPEGWLKLFAEAGYSGDWYWTIVE